MKQTWLLSCLGSLGKRKKTFEGKLNAMFSKETSGTGKSTIAVSAASTAAVVGGAVAVPATSLTQEEVVPCPLSQPVAISPPTKGSAKDAVLKEIKKDKHCLGGRLVKIAKERKAARKKAEAKKKLLFATNTVKKQEIVADARVSSKGAVSARVSKKFL